jgi:hypothetical protein
MNNGETKTIEVSIYKPEHKILWDNFVLHSKNGVFLFNRDYMEYHSNRFQDNSLLFFIDGRLIGLLPANLRGETLYSHEGLTFGSVISNSEMKISTMLQVFEELIKYCKEKNIRRVFYKSIPYIYHSIPADEDLYALFRNGATIIARSPCSTISFHEKVEYSRERTKAIRKAQKNGLFVKRSYDLKSFMKLIEDVLMERHGVKPVHSFQEMALLMERFSDNIKLFTSYQRETMLAGCLIYESKNVAHVQYGFNSNVGLNLGALDLVYDYLISEYGKIKKYFDFGISTEKQGQMLNFGLARQKEGFGARAVTHDFYQLTINE